MRERAWIVALLLGGCVFPSDSPTGIEFSWALFEVEPSDGDDGRRVLTCAAQGVDTVIAAIRDVDDHERAGRFRFGCDEGYQTARDLARSSSDAFVELHPGDYDVALYSDRPEQPLELLALRTVEVLERAVTLELWEFTLAPVDWTLALRSRDGCTEAAFRLEFADPQGALGELEVDEDGAPEPVLYRAALVSDRGLGVAGQTHACPEIHGTHRFVGVDRGRYRLVVDVDGAECAIEVGLGESATTALDLAALPCSR